jgi:hypothetical protein
VSIKHSSQIDFFNIQFDKDFPMELKPYAYEILQKLYINSNGLNIKETYTFFNNDKVDKVRDTLAKLSSTAYSMIFIDKSKCKGSEKRYFITEAGRKALTSHYNNL